jgi:hypothetical protein
MKKIPNHKYVKLIGSLLLFVIAVIEIIEGWEKAEIEIEHGAALFAISHLVSVILELYESNKIYHEARDT